MFDSDVGEEGFSEGDSEAVSISPRGNYAAGIYDYRSSQAPHTNHERYQSEQVCAGFCFFCLCMFKSAVIIVFCCDANNL